jgi:ATP-dependent DNA helicase DinG
VTAFTETELEKIFSADGVFASRLSNYRFRSEQLHMAKGVAGVLGDGGVLVAEAGTGTGKTLAYLVPALLAGGKTIISTGTKALQDQLFRRDIPAVLEALSVPLKTSLLKGRANYVCQHHLERNLADGRFASAEEAATLHRIQRFAAASDSGDRAEATGIRETHPAWTYAVSTRENCLGSECAHFRDCFVMKARKQALESELVVVNHHLFFADLWLRDEGVAELLPASHNVILDEAHQLADTAALFFGQSVTTGQLIDMARDARQAALVFARDTPELAQAGEKLDKAAKNLRMSVPEMGLRQPARQMQERVDFARALDEMKRALAELDAGLKAHAERAEELADCHARSHELTRRLENWQGKDEADWVRWVETAGRSLALHATPLSVAEFFGAQVMQDGRAWVLTSATLAVGGDFSHLLARLGLEEAKTLCVDSPFDYPRQGLVYLPTGLPEPNTREHTQAVVDAALPVLEASGGRAFMLFTSLRAMDNAKTMLADAFKSRGLDFPLLAQGDEPKQVLLERFQQSGRAVLLGSQSFWEGVDMPGETLSLVIIDKLPFAPPDDPVVSARIARINEAGGNAFMEYQLPEAVISLKQGAGRLIRTETDLGVLMLCDPRLMGKSYGRKVLDALPPMRRTRKLEEVRSFFASGVAV